MSPSRRHLGLARPPGRRRRGVTGVDPDRHVKIARRPESVTAHRVGDAAVSVGQAVSGIGEDRFAQVAVRTSMVTLPEAGRPAAKERRGYQK